MINRRTFTTLAGATLLAPVLATSATAKGGDYPPTEGEMQGFVLNEERVSATDTPFFTADETARSFADYKGKVLVVNFWATWCAPCIHEMPSLDRLQAAFSPEDVQLLLISQDRGGPAQVEPFLTDTLQLPDLPVFYDNRMQLGRAMGVRGLPTTIVIDAKGDVVGTLAGPAEWDHPDAIALVQHVVDEAKG